jgi:hypothetical protein
MNKSFSFSIQADIHSNWSSEILEMENITEDEASEILEALVLEGELLLYENMEGNVTVDEENSEVYGDYRGWSENEEEWLGEPETFSIDLDVIMSWS